MICFSTLKIIFVLELAGAGEQGGFVLGGCESVFLDFVAHTIAKKDMNPVQCELKIQRLIDFMALEKLSLRYLYAIIFSFFFFSFFHCLFYDAIVFQ